MLRVNKHYSFGMSNLLSSNTQFLTILLARVFSGSSKLLPQANIGGTNIKGRRQTSKDAAKRLPLRGGGKSALFPPHFGRADCASRLSDRAAVPRGVMWGRGCSYTPVQGVAMSRRLPAAETDGKVTAQAKDRTRTTLRKRTVTR